MDDFKNRVIAHLKEQGLIERELCIGTLPAGFMVAPILLETRDGQGRMTVKTQRFNNLEDARLLALLIAEYAKRLEKAGIAIPKNHQTLVSKDSSSADYLALEIASYEGKSLAAQFSHLGAVKIAEMVFSLLFGMFKQQPGDDLDIGIDPSCNNFTYNLEKGGAVYIDFIPPRYSIEGVPMVDYPHPTEQTDLKSQIRRFYTKTGVALIALTQILRHEPEAYYDILRILMKLAHQSSQPEVTKKIVSLTEALSVLTSPNEILNPSRPEEARLLGILNFNRGVVSKAELREIFQNTHIDESTRLIPEAKFSAALPLLIKPELT
ncbi:MAG: hypothetical protein WCV50_03900 [Patescibacteria group bacterium]|jgi:hypothetical protein